MVKKEKDMKIRDFLLERIKKRRAEIKERLNKAKKGKDEKK